MIGGDVPAEAILVVTDLSGQDRRYVEWGMDTVDSEEGNPPLLLEADEQLVVEGYSGELTELEGSHSGEVVKATLRPTALVLCSTGAIEHVGSYRQKLRVQTSGEGALFHISYRVGDGPWVTSLPWVEPAQVGQWMELDLGEAFLEETEKGEQVSEIRIEAKVEETNCTGYVDTLGLMPTRRYGVARAPLNLDTPTDLLVADSFNQAEDEATGKEAEAGGKYEAVPSSAEEDFTIAKGKLKRIATEDSGTFVEAFFGRGIGTSQKLTDFVMRCDFAIESTSFASLRFGHILNYVDSEHFILVWLGYLGDGGTSGPWQIVVSSPSGGTVGYALNVLYPPAQGTLLSHVSGERLTLHLGANLEKVLSVEHPMVGVEGKAFLYDENRGETAATREYDNLAIWEPDQPVACPPGRSLEIRSDAAERENPEGTYWSPVPRYRGANFYLDPAGDSGQINRIAVKMRRNDTKEEPDASLADKQSIEVRVRERFLSPR
jgi:hypothetical protein